MRTPWLTRCRLLALMFLEYFVWGAWSVPISSYMNGSLGLSGTQIGWISGAAALGALVSPVFVGYIADRFFSTDRMLAVLHLAGAVCLLLAARQTTFPALMTVMVINALCFMPTLPLINNLTLRNIDNADKFPRIVVGGTVGWIVAGLAVGFFLGEITGAFFTLAAAVEGLLALYSLTLPHTPPKGADQRAQDVLGLTAAKLFREPAFLVFAVSIPLVMIASGFYYTWTNAFLSETRISRPTALMTLSQVSGFVVLILLPWFIAKLGLKRVIVIGMGAWAIRYLLFASTNLPAAAAALLLHGFAYDFVVIGASIYVARLVPAAMSARAQSFVAMLIFGAGMFFGAQVAGITGHWYRPATILAARLDGQGGEQLLRAPLPEWGDRRDGKASLPHMLGARGDLLRLSLIESLPEEGIIVERAGRTRYARKELMAVFAEADRDGDGIVTRSDWQRIQRHAWPQIWMWGAVLAFGASLLFWFGGREVQRATESEPRAQ